MQKQFRFLCIKPFTSKPEWAGHMWLSSDRAVVDCSEYGMVVLFLSLDILFAWITSAKLYNGTVNIETRGRRR